MRNEKTVFVLAVLFLIANQLFIWFDLVWLSIVPLILLIAFFFLFAYDKLLFLCVFVTPLSITLSQFDIGTSLSLPSEPLLLFTTLLFLSNQLYKSTFDLKIIKHPLTILIIIHLLWLFLTSVTSEMPFVSFKYLISRLWFVIPCYFFIIQLFKDHKKISTFYWLYIIPLSLVILFSTARLWMSGFNDDFSQSAMTPFYPSHTSYGAIIAMFLPFLAFSSIRKTNTPWVRWISGFLFLFFCLATILSYSRAVWVSIPAAILLYFILIIKIRFRTVASILLLLFALLYSMKSEIIIELQKNKQDSSEELVENFQSISNISTDDSNTERLNRWTAAISMFKERPIYGWGPGTYQFQYAPFQNSKNLTLISTNSGDLGNAHSEYIGPFAETGIIGGLIFISIALYAIALGFSLVYNADNEQVRFLAISTLLGVSTYLIHGFLNNYLDTDKAAIPFWGFLAILVSLDIYKKR